MNGVTKHFKNYIRKINVLMLLPTRIESPNSLMNRTKEQKIIIIIKRKKGLQRDYYLYINNFHFHMEFISKKMKIVAGFK